MLLNERSQRREQTENGASGGFNVSGVEGKEEQRKNGQIMPRPEGGAGHKYCGGIDLQLASVHSGTPRMCSEVTSRWALERPKSRGGHARPSKQHELWIAGQEFRAGLMASGLKRRPTACLFGTLQTMGFVHSLDVICVISGNSASTE